MERNQVGFSFTNPEGLVEQYLTLPETCDVFLELEPAVEENFCNLEAVEYVEMVDLQGDYRDLPELQPLPDEILLSLAVDDWLPTQSKTRPEGPGRKGGKVEGKVEGGRVERWKAGKNKHRKGREQQPLENISVENRPNVLRCRDYRSQKKQREEKKLTDLQLLEQKHRELVRMEREVKEKRDRVQNAYLALINRGRIKFAVDFKL